MSFTDDDLRRCLEVLQEVSEDPSVMAGNSRFKSLVAKIHRKGKTGKRQALRRQKAEADDRLVQQTAVVRQQLGGLDRLPAPASGVYHRPRRCYVCKEPYTRVHSFYHLLCPNCADLNWAKRNQRADLSGRAALITGGRIKIGFQTALKLLRDGARVIATTRFPQDAARRFLAEADHAGWIGRLQIHGLDLRDLPAVEAFAQRLLRQEASLDILIHNAAQTVKRPLAFYQHLLEQQAGDSSQRSLIPTQPGAVLLEARPGYRGDLPGAEAYFPPEFDHDGQQVDQRPMNSWRLGVGEVSTVELLEVFLVGTLSPFVLTRALLPALTRSPHARRFIVSVSAMEGQFARGTKNAFHPHTNMAKAALNMMTRTSAGELAGQGVYLNSVDTGWITDEKPLPLAEAVREGQGFYLPLDVIDGASRVYDPVARGVNGTQEPVYGHFLKDYAPYPW